MKIYDRNTRTIKEPGPATIHFATSGKIRFSVGVVERLELNTDKRVIFLEDKEEWFVAYLDQQDPTYARGLSLHQQGQSLHCHSRTITRNFLRHLELRKGHSFPLAVATTIQTLDKWPYSKLATYAILTATRLNELRYQRLRKTAKAQ